MEYVILAIVVIGVGYYFLSSKNNDNDVSSTPTETSAPVADANNNGITSKAELKKLTKVQLVDFAEKNNLKVKKSGTKAAVINEIHSQLKK
tara:strand:+ start:3822 stop:4094 length:273 start_codon:yes stop_codon:yes gene_type:complete